MQAQQKSNQEGFTLIEILLAIGILAFGLLAIGAMQVMAIKTTGRADRLTTEATTAMNQMEQIITTTYANLPVQNSIVQVGGSSDRVGAYNIQYVSVNNHPTNSSSARSATITARLTPVNNIFNDQSTVFTFIKTWFYSSEDTYRP